METSNESTSPTLFDPTLYAADTPANPSAPQAKEKAKKTRATSGRGYEKPFAFYDPVTQSLKMYEATCPLADLPSLAKLPPSGTLQNGVLYLRPPWEPITEETESSFWPTPTTQEFEHHDAIWNHKNRRVAKNGKSTHGMGLADAVQRWPTPQANDWKNAVVRHREKSMQVMFGGALATSDPSLIGGRLNPTWVEWLMGFPIGWSALEDSETPSSPKSPK